MYINDLSFRFEDTAGFVMLSTELEAKLIGSSFAGLHELQGEMHTKECATHQQLHALQGEF